MAFDPGIEKGKGDLIRSQDWNDAMNAIVALFGKLDPVAGHKHTGTTEDAPVIGEQGVADGAISTDKIQGSAVTTNKISNRAVTADKIAPGVIPEIGISIAPRLTDGGKIPAPAGFEQNDCMYFAFIRSINFDTGILPIDKKVIISCYADSKGMVTATPAGEVEAWGIAIGRKGGWGITLPPHKKEKKR